MKRLPHFLTLLSILFLLNACDSGGGGGSTGPRTVVAFGDSITADFNYPGTPPWPELLKSQRPEWTIINRAQGSERMSGVRRKADGSITEDTDVVVIMVGSVNVLFSDFGTYESDMRETIAIARSRGAKVLLCTIPPMSGGRIGFASSVDRLNATIRNIANTSEANLVNIFGELDGAPERFPDGLHPDLDGQRIISVAIREKI